MVGYPSIQPKYQGSIPALSHVNGLIFSELSVFLVLCIVSFYVFGYYYAFSCTFVGLKIDFCLPGCSVYGYEFD